MFPQAQSQLSKLHEKILSYLVLNVLSRTSCHDLLIRRPILVDLIEKATLITHVWCVDDGISCIVVFIVVGSRLHTTESSVTFCLPI